MLPFLKELETEVSKVTLHLFLFILSNFSIHSVEVILDRFKKLDVLEMFLEDLSMFTSLEVINTYISDEVKIVKSISKIGLDFDDSLQYYVAKKRALQFS